MSFCDLQGKYGRIQLYVRKGKMDAEYLVLRGEMSARVQKVALRLCLRIFTSVSIPRLRYVDLIVNPEVKQNCIIRSQFLKHVRNFKDARDYFVQISYNMV